MRKKVTIIAALAAATIGAGLAFAGTQAVKQGDPTRTPVEFYKGHWHDEHGNAHGAPAHSGGTDAAGCHNGSVPYHCH